MHYMKSSHAHILMQMRLEEKGKRKNWFTDRKKTEVIHFITWKQESFRAASRYKQAPHANCVIRVILYVHCMSYCVRRVQNSDKLSSLIRVILSHTDKREKNKNNYMAKMHHQPLIHLHWLIRCGSKYFYEHFDILNRKRLMETVHVKYIFQNIQKRWHIFKQEPPDKIQDSCCNGCQKEKHITWANKPVCVPVSSKTERKTCVVSKEVGAEEKIELRGEFGRRGELKLQV